MDGLLLRVLRSLYDFSPWLVWRAWWNARYYRSALFVSLPYCQKCSCWSSHHPCCPDPTLRLEYP